MTIFSTLLSVVLFVYIVLLVDGQANGTLARWLEAKARLKSIVLSKSSVRWKLCPDTTLLLNLSFKIYDVLACNEVEQSFTTVNFMALAWRDPGLAWDPADFEDLQSLTFAYDDLWHPRIAVTNAADQEFALIKPLNDQVDVTFTGEVGIKSPLFLKTTCSMDLTWYPFDQQDCQIVFLPFLDDCEYTIASKILENLPNPFQLTGEWEIMLQNVTPFVYNTAYSKGLIAARISLVVVRRPLFYVITFIAPMVLTSLMTSFVFIIPPDSGEKVSFLVSIFVSNAVFLNFIAGTLPRAMTLHNIPRLTLLLIGVLVQGSLALLATLYVMRKYQSEQNPKDQLSTPGRTKKQFQVSDPSTHNKESNKVVDGVQNFGKEVVTGESLTQNMEARGLHRLTSRLWDLMFFVLFNIASIAFYFMLVTIPSEAKPSWSYVL